MLSKGAQLSLYYFKDQYRFKKPKKILNISKEFIPFSDTIKIEYFNKKIDKVLPFENNRFNFVYTNEDSLHNIFGTPIRMNTELSRISINGGWIETTSPLGVILYDSIPDTGYITWTDIYTNSLCFMLYTGPLSKQSNHKREEWLKLAYSNNMYLKNFYTWTYIFDMNFTLYEPETREEYEHFIMEGMVNSAKYTRFLLDKYDNKIC